MALPAILGSLARGAAGGAASGAASKVVGGKDSNEGSSKPANDRDEISPGKLGIMGAPLTLSSPVATQKTAFSPANDLTTDDTPKLLKMVVRMLSSINTGIEQQNKMQIAESKAEREAMLEGAPATGLSPAEKAMDGHASKLGLFTLAIGATVMAVAASFDAITETVSDMFGSVGDALDAFKSKINSFFGLEEDSPVGDIAVGGPVQAGVVAGKAVRDYVSGGNDSAESQQTPSGRGGPLPQKYAKFAQSDPDFHKEVTRVAKKFNVGVDELYGVIDFETGGKMRTDTINPGSSATGLIQFMTGKGSWARGKGLTRDKLKKMSRAEQMKWVDRYFEENGLGNISSPHAGHLYTTVAGPAALKRRDGVLYKRGTEAYRKNTIWDTNKDGVITIDELGGIINDRVNLRRREGGQGFRGSKARPSTPAAPTTPTNMGIEAAHQLRDTMFKPANPKPSSRVSAVPPTPYAVKKTAASSSPAVVPVTRQAPTRMAGSSPPVVSPNSSASSDYGWYFNLRA